MFFVVFLAGVIVGGLTGLLDENWFILIILGMLVIGLIDAYRNAYTAEYRARYDERMQDIAEQAKFIQQYQEKGHEIAVDTNILMHDSALFIYLLEQFAMNLHMSMMVFNELDGLKKGENPETRQRAQFAFDVIEEFQRADKLHMIKTPRTDEIRKYGLSGSPDEKIIGTYLREIEKGKEKLLFLSNDKGARIIARNAGMPIVEI